MEEGWKIPDARNNRYGLSCLPLRHGCPSAKPGHKKTGIKMKWGKQMTYVCITSVTKATKARNISLRLIRRRRRPTTTRSRLRDRRRGSLRRSDSRVHRSSHTQTGLSLLLRLLLLLVGQDCRVTHVGRRLLLVRKAKLQTIGTTGRAPVGDITGRTRGSDGHRGFSGMVTGSRLGGSGGAIDDSDAGRVRGGLRRLLLLLLLLHGFAAHRRS